MKLTRRSSPEGSPARSPERRRLPNAALLILAVLLAGVVIFLTWPAQKLVTCESLPELTALAACAAVLFVFSARTLSNAHRAQQELRLPGGALILAALALFLAAHFVAVYRAPCVAVQHQFHHR